jgi:hypothetical protein
MKIKIMMALLLITAALALSVAAQDKTKYLDMRLHRLAEVVLRVVTPAGGNQGNPAGVGYEPLPSWAVKLRIEMQDGATQEIDLKNVKKMTVSSR